MVPSALKRDILRICQALYAKDYVSAMDGNVSARLPGGHILATRTMVHKGFITEDDLVVVDLSGRKVSGRGDPTSEMSLHLAAYRNRPEIGAVVHAHPPTAVAFTIAGESLAQCVLPEVVLTLGEIHTVPYETTGTAALADAVGAVLKTYDAVMMDRHGAVCVGQDLLDAFGKLEKVEHTAMITHRARLLGNVKTLPETEIARLHALGAKYRTTDIPVPCQRCSGCPNPAPWQSRPAFQVGRLTASPLKYTAPPPPGGGGGNHGS